ncbi:hypothetical protein CFN78_02470 [Amycolatopsis antarctica]|uniref:Uncharacterized protein n=1 Tax=Amycolatopsis antarctica TaxID=1854586 RepID=A0A263DA00_9PSEU|nr:hypothetical protein CFN78_02470 [Amycolatopsis antarctica]
MLVTALCAVLVTVGAVITAVLLRQNSAAGVAPVPGGAPSIEPACGAGPCTAIASATAGGDTVELLADGSGSGGQVRFGTGAAATVIETALTGSEVQLTADSLRCADGVVPTCLVRGPFDQGTIGEVLVKRGNGWESAGQPYFSDAGAIVLDDVLGDGTAEVINVQRNCAPGDSTADCGQARVLARVLDIDGAEQGCTKTYRTPGELRGWPDVSLTERDLRDCPGA